MMGTRLARWPGFGRVADVLWHRVMPLVVIAVLVWVYVGLVPKGVVGTPAEAAVSQPTCIFINPSD